MVLDPMGSTTVTGSRQNIYSVINMMATQTICGKSDGCMPRLSIGGILSKDRLNQIAARQKAMMAAPTTHDSIERLEDKLKINSDLG